MLIQENSSPCVHLTMIRILRQHLELGTDGETQTRALDCSELQTIHRGISSPSMQSKSTIMHYYGAFIFSSSLHKSASLRYEAVLFLRSVLHQGISALYLCLPNMVIGP